ncbi:hypothetical protein Q3G72_004154 [Acer saccharum]|nr:hypothetical protein Q3G72_004154 [Acer saccharum]
MYYSKDKSNMIPAVVVVVVRRQSPSTSSPQSILPSLFLADSLPGIEDSGTNLRREFGESSGRRIRDFIWDREIR